jgi:hypothetical protein
MEIHLGAIAAPAGYLSRLTESKPSIQRDIPRRNGAADLEQRIGSFQADFLYRSCGAQIWSQTSQLWQTWESAPSAVLVPAQGKG